jgi:hypothetical protein
LRSFRFFAVAASTHLHGATNARKSVHGREDAEKQRSERREVIIAARTDSNGDGAGATRDECRRPPARSYRSYTAARARQPVDLFTIANEQWSRAAHSNIATCRKAISASAAAATWRCAA